MRPVMRGVATLLLGASTACTGLPAGIGSGTPPASSPRLGSAIVISGQQLWGRSGDLLSAMSGRISNMRVDRRSSGCPLVTLRGAKTIVGTSNPQVYVDGMRLSDTCILDQIRVAEVERVEVYPGGSAGRAGYRSSPYGLIAVFLVTTASAR